MAAGDATAADVPAKYDCVINGKGYCFADSVEPSLPFRTHRAIYDISPTFVERQNVSSVYGDQAQDFFPTSTQNDWSLGEDQKFFRIQDADSARRYWLGSNVDVTVPGQVTLRPAVSTLTMAAAVSNAVWSSPNSIFTASSTNLYEIGPTGTITDRGAHGAGGLADAICTDGTFIYLSGNACTSIRKYDQSAHTFAAFSATAAGSMCFLNNTLYGTKGGILSQYDTSGSASTIFTWKNAVGTSLGNTRQIVSFGGKIAILTPSAQNASGAELWIYDGTAPTIVARFPETFTERVIFEADGILFVAGTEINSNFGARTVVYYLAQGTLGRLYSSQNWFTGSYAGVAGGRFQGGLLLTDIANSCVRFYNLAAGGVSTVAPLTPPTGDVFIGQGATSAAITQGSTSVLFFPSNSNAATSGYVASSLMDFDNSLTKTFRGIKVDFTAAADGNGGSVDIAYQVDSVNGSYTSLQTGATSGTEYLLSGVSGHSISVKITLNKGTSTLGPILKRVYVRAAPQLQQFKSGLYILDCTNTASQPRELRNGTYHPLTGYEQVQNLLTAAKATTPFSVTDKVNGTFTALVDLSDSEGWDVYEVHPDADNPSKPGTYMVRIKVREV